MSNSVLYIIVRTDMASMTPGRVAAQAAHAHGLMEAVFEKYDNTPIKHIWNNWKADRGFGTTIVLSDIDNTNTREDLEDLEYLLREYNDGLDNVPVHISMVHDETYPIRDGVVTHYISVNTCLVVFVIDKNQKPDILNCLQLYTGRENV